MFSFRFPRRLAGLVVALVAAVPLPAADYPKPEEGDHVLRDFRFASG